MKKRAQGRFMRVYWGGTVDDGERLITVALCNKSGRATAWLTTDAQDVGEAVNGWRSLYNPTHIVTKHDDLAGILLEQGVQVKGE